MHQSHSIRVVGLLILAALAATIIAACSTETIVERTVIVERQVKGDDVIVKGDDVIVEQTVIVERQMEVAVKGDDVIVEQTVIVEKEVKVKGDTVVVLAGKDQFRADAGSWRVLGADALLHDGFVPDFSAFVNCEKRGEKTKIRCLKVRASEAARQRTDRFDDDI